MFRLAHGFAEGSRCSDPNRGTCRRRKPNYLLSELAQMTESGLVGPSAGSARPEDGKSWSLQESSLGSARVLPDLLVNAHEFAGHHREC